jgi:Na+(H+)/acetate symporter ActP
VGKYTFADVVAFRLQPVPVRIAAAFGGILTLLFYVLAQMVGAGNPVRLMFGISYEWAVVIVGAVMLMYVLFGGMIATTCLSPTIWVELLREPAAIFPLRNPAIVSMPLSFLCGIVASLQTREPAAAASFDDEKLRTYLGIGAE